MTQRGRVRVFRGLGLEMGCVLRQWSVRASMAESAARMGIRGGEDALSRLIQLDWSLPSSPPLASHFHFPYSPFKLSTILLISPPFVAVYLLVADVALVLAAAVHPRHTPILPT